MIPIFYRGHIFSFSEDPYEVGLVVESAVIAYLRRAQCCICKQVAGFGDSQIVHIRDERDARLSLKEMAECRVGHVDEFRCIRKSDLL